VSRVSAMAGREEIEVQRFAVHCERCQKSYELPGWKAEIHSVEVVDCQG
jgi:hypothetical protein